MEGVQQQNKDITNKVDVDVCEHPVDLIFISDNGFKRTAK